MNTPYRFIAGAVCPQCRAEDRIVANDFSVKCVVCDFEEFREDQKAPASESMPKTLAQPIRFLKPSKNEEG